MLTKFGAGGSNMLMSMYMQCLASRMESTSYSSLLYKNFMLFKSAQLECDHFLDVCSVLSWPGCIACDLFPLSDTQQTINNGREPAEPAQISSAVKRVGEEQRTIKKKEKQWQDGEGQDGRRFGGAAEATRGTTEVYINSNVLKANTPRDSGDPPVDEQI